MNQNLGGPDGRSSNIHTFVGPTPWSNAGACTRFAEARQITLSKLVTDALTKAHPKDDATT